MTVATGEGTLWVEDRVVPAVVVVADTLDDELTVHLRQVLVSLTNGQLPDIVVDLSNLNFIDSVGLGVLATAQLRARSNGGRVTVLSRPSLSQAMRLAGLGEIIWQGPVIWVDPHGTYRGGSVLTEVPAPFQEELHDVPSKVGLVVLPPAPSAVTQRRRSR